MSSRHFSSKIVALFLCTLVSLGCESSEQLASRSSGIPSEVSDYQQVSEHLYSCLLSKPKPSEGTRFKNLEDCGVSFKNYMRRDRTNMLLETGSGVALGDYLSLIHI